MCHRTAVLILFVTLITGCGGGALTSVTSPDVPSVPIPAPVPSPENQPDPLYAPRSPYVGFESAPVRPIAATENRLFVANPSNHTVEVFELDKDGIPSHQHTVAVGLEPVALGLASESELWVVNHLSDSVSIVDLVSPIPLVRRTLLVGDEPQDIVFANGRAFISTAHRGQHLVHSSLKGVPGAGDPQLHTSGVGRADVWVFNVAEPGQALGGLPEKIVNLFGDSPRAMAVSPDGDEVYVGVFHSGNQTTVIHEGVMCQGFEDDEYGRYPCQVMDGITSPNGMAQGWLPGGRTAPGVNREGEYQPWTSMIVKYDRQSGQWRDTKGRNFSNGVRFHLPDLDVFSIDSSTLNPRHAYAHVGTTLFNLSVHPQTGDLFVSNTEANNAQRFEGSGTFSGSTVQGNIARTRITHIDTARGRVSPRHLNRHIDYRQLKASPDIKAHSLSTPTQMSVSSDGLSLYLAAMGSDKIAVFPIQQLQDASWWDGEGQEFDPTLASENYIEVPGGPSGLFLDEQRNRLFVYTKFDNGLVTLDLETGIELSRFHMQTPEPESFQTGRSMLYDARRSSSNGESSCASCHVFGDTDHLSWNLGDPDAPNKDNPQPFPLDHLPRLGCDLVGEQEESCRLLQIINGNGDLYSIASMKGPMATQTMRGMSTHGHLHWRGDRASGYFGSDTEQTLDERKSFKNFIVAFEGLLGLDIELPESTTVAEKSDDVLALERDMDKFADFMLAVSMPPNPVRNLDNSLTSEAAMGADFFFGIRRSDGLADDVDINGTEQDGVNCAGCHGVDPAKGFYGTRGEIGHGGEIQILKIPQLRNLYTRVGMFGLPDREGFLPSHTKHHQGNQIRGFGFLHDGATDQLLNFLKGGVFDNGEEGCPRGVNSAHGCDFNQGFVGIPDERTRHGLVEYLMAFDNDLAPIVGQQITLHNRTRNFVSERIHLLKMRAQTPFVSKILGGQVTECDLIAIGVMNDISRGYLYLPEHNAFRSDMENEELIGFQQLLEQGSTGSNTLTYTCAVPGQGWRMALDRDLDGIFNGDSERR